MFHYLIAIYRFTLYCLKSLPCLLGYPSIYFYVVQYDYFVAYISQAKKNERTVHIINIVKNNRVINNYKTKKTI